MDTVPAAFTRFCVAVAAVLLLPAIAQAQGLGPMRVLSAVGQPLRAEVPIVSVRAKDDAGVHGSIATPDDYKALGVAFDPVLFSISVALENRGTGAVLVLTSSRPINEPYLDLLVVLQTASGRLIRDYTILLDSR